MFKGLSGQYTTVTTIAYFLYYPNQIASYKFITTGTSFIKFLVGHFFPCGDLHTQKEHSMKYSPN